MRVVGIDLSYSRTGFADLKADDCGNGRYFGLDRFKTKPGPLIPRTVEIVDWVFEKIYSGTTPDLIVIERAVFGGQRASMLSGLCVAVLVDIYKKFSNCDVLLVLPPKLKQWAGVKGNEKSLMVQAFHAVHPAIKACHDEVDAYFLASLGMEFVVGQRDGVMDAVAHDILFSPVLTKKGIPKGLALRDEFFVEAHSGV